MKIIPPLLIAASLCFASMNANAVGYDFTGDTTGGTTFNRPTEAGDQLSAIGTDVSFFARVFSVSVAGAYSFSAVASDPANYDTFIHLYNFSFDPLSPLNNLIGANDDASGDPALGSAISGQTLLAGQLYVFVIDGFGNFDFGSFSASINGPGVVTLGVGDASSTMVLAGIAFGSLFLVRRYDPFACAKA